jgi:hypothetical protein
MRTSLKSIAVTAILACGSFGAHAVDLVISNPVVTGLVPVGAFDVTISGFTATNGTIGTLEIDGPGVVTYTYLGKEASYNNNLFNLGGSPATILDTAAIGTTSSQTYAAQGLLSFAFNTTSPIVHSVSNGSATNTPPTFAIFSGGTSGYKYILGYDDKGAGPDRDFDDMVIGVTVVPEPEAYGLALAGMGVVAFAMRRRRSDKPA